MKSRIALALHAIFPSKALRAKLILIFGQIQITTSDFESVSYG